MSIKKISKHTSHYLPLLGMFAATLLGFCIFSYDKGFQMALIIASSVGYLSWGIVHHYIHKDLYISVFIEYFSVALLGVVISYFILFRA